MNSTPTIPPSRPSGTAYNKSTSLGVYVGNLYKVSKKLPVSKTKTTVDTAEASRLGNSTQKYACLARYSALRQFQTQQCPAEWIGDEGSQHPADAGIAHRARFLLIELELIGDQRAYSTAGVRQRRFRAQARPGDERHEGRDHDPGGVAIVEASGFAKFAHQLSKDRRYGRQRTSPAARPANHRWYKQLR